MAQLLWGNWWDFCLGVVERGYNSFGVTVITHIRTSRLRITGTVPPSTICHHGQSRVNLTSTVYS